MIGWSGNWPLMIRFVDLRGEGTAGSLGGLLGKVAEDVVADVVASGLLGEEEGLDKLARRGRVASLIGDGTLHHEQHSTSEGGLGVHDREMDLALLEAQRSDLLVDVL